MPRTEILINQKETQPRIISRPAFEQILEDCLRNDPNRTICLANIAKELGISRERTRQLYNKIAKEKDVPIVKSKKMPVSPEELDQKVEKLTQEGLNSRAISGMLQIRFKEIEHARARNNRLRKERQKNLVRQLRKQGCGNKEIAEKTGISLFNVAGILKHLRNNGEKARLRIKRASEDELSKRDTKVMELRERHFTRIQIADETGLSLHLVGNSIQRLVKNQKIQPLK